MVGKEKLNKLKERSQGSLWLEGTFGVEKENVRVDHQGKLVLSPHPIVFGDKLEHPYVTTDFSESQIEMVTPPLSSIDETLGFLETLHDIISLELDDELLWPQSAPPILPAEEEIPIARYSRKGKSHEEYREMLAQKYGKKIQMLSGIHFNLSFSESLLQFLYKEEDGQVSYAEFKEQAYLRTAQRLLQYRWLPIILFGASPAVDQTLEPLCSGVLNEKDKSSFEYPELTSFRNSRCGYRNKEEFVIDYSSFEGYWNTLGELIQTKKLYHAKELYTSVRLKFDPQSNGFSHLELRFLDLNPMEKIGVKNSDLYFIHALCLFSLLDDHDMNFDNRLQDISCYNHEMAARKGANDNLSLLDFNGDAVNAIEWADQVVDKMENLFQSLGIQNKDYLDSFTTARGLIHKRESRAASKVLKAVRNEGFVPFHLRQALSFLEDSKKNTYAFKGYEDLELSTQLVMREAVRRGVHIEILDRKENFLRLSKDGHTQVICQATKTALDNYAGILMMENKVVTKKILADNQIRVPIGGYFAQMQDAQDSFWKYEGESIVIKPKTTNFGLGISILKNNNDRHIFNRAVELAFEQDDSILIEEFISGKEYRFFVMDDEVVGILHRVPANVIGDGKHSIRELVEIKNQDPLRGKAYRTPLEKISLLEPEEMFLAEQSLNFDTIPANNQQVFLRENSNISTGGDSLDFTDDVHPSYKEIAVRAMKAMDVRITGLDMMINDISQKASLNNYAIIELNFNPAIHIHCHPYKGENRRLNEKLLDMLGF